MYYILKPVYNISRFSCWATKQTSHCSVATYFVYVNRLKSKLPETFTTVTIGIGCGGNTSCACLPPGSMLEVHGCLRSNANWIKLNNYVGIFLYVAQIKYWRKIIPGIGQLIDYIFSSNHNCNFKMPCNHNLLQNI